MKTKKHHLILPSISPSFSEFRRIRLALASVVLTTVLALSANAANVLVNPSFDSSPLFASGSWSQHASETWSMASATAADPTSIKLIHSGANGLWMQGLYGNGQGGPQTSYAAQSFACAPGSTYTADAWYSAYLVCNGHIGGDDGSTPPGGNGLYGSDSSGNEDGWVEVMFFDSANVLIADYKSAIMDPAFVRDPSLPTLTNSLGNIYLAWVHCQVTNQYDPATVTANNDPSTTSPAGPPTQVITNTLALGQYITAPPGAARGEFRINLYQAAGESGAPFWDDASLTQVYGASASTLDNVSPDGTKFFNGASTAFTFNVDSASAGGAPLPTNPTSGIGVVVNGQNKSASLQFGGTPTGLNVTLPGLASNSLYTITINVTNSAALTSSKTVSFDTFPTDVFIVSAEDYDYTNGLFIQNPVPTSAPAANSYFGTAGVLGVDMSTYGGGGALPGGASQLVRADNNVAMQKADDIQLPQYAAANDPNVYNVQIAYNNGGNWENYTRNYPTGNYLVYLRYNDNTPGNYESLNLVTSGNGTPTQTTTNLGRFVSAGIGASYAWVPLTDTFGNKVIVNLTAGQNTLQLFSGGLANFVDFIFVPSGNSFPPVINNLSPNQINAGANAIFLNVTNITYSVSSAFNTVSTNNIHTVINGVDVSSSATYTGNNTSWNVTVPCPQNKLVTLSISATDGAGVSNSVSETFDTFTQNNMMIEASDWDFNGGQFIDNPTPTANFNPATNSYFLYYFPGGVDGATGSVAEIDYHGAYQNEGAALSAYRAVPGTPPSGDFLIACQNPTGDFLRNKFVNPNGPNFLDYNIGYFNSGFWANYTRTFPAGNYNIIGRFADGAGAPFNSPLSLVTSGQHTATQTTQLLGTFSGTSLGWTTYEWSPLRDANGNLVNVPLSGVQTLRLTSAGNNNVTFLMLVPSAVSLSVNLSVSVSGTTISLHYPSANGHTYTVQWNTTMTGGTWQTLGVAATGDGTVKTATDTMTPGGTKFYRLLIQ